MGQGRPDVGGRGSRSGPWWAVHPLIGVMGALAMLALTGCAALRPGATPTSTPTTLPATPETVPGSPTPGTLPTPTPHQETPRPGPPTSSPTPLPASPSPSATPSPSPTAGAAVIHSFRADVDVADPGDTITLSWHWSGGEGATIYHLFPTGQLSEPFWEVGPTGSLDYTISPDRRNTDMFVLYVFDQGAVAAQDTLVIALTCPDEWFFTGGPDICPTGPALFGEGAEQHFQGGTMVWVGAEDRIYVLFHDPQYRRWRAYQDEWDEGDPTMDPTIEPPAGLLQPVRGFGLVWRENPEVRERLGWALREEQGYETALQRTSHVRYPDLYIRAADGGVWKLGPNGSAWEYVAVRD